MYGVHVCTHIYAVDITATYIPRDILFYLILRNDIKLLNMLNSIN